jgi:hypothetical protein
MLKTNREEVDTTIKSNGQQEDYLVLPTKKDFIRPVRTIYKHLVCNTNTSMPQAIAETYAQDPTFYSGTFCVACGGHFPIAEEGEFVWLDDNSKVGT